MARLGQVRHGISRQRKEKEFQMSDDINNLTGVTESEPWPLDVTTLAKGQVITQGQCEHIIGMKADHLRFPFELMRIREHIMSESERTGVPLSVAIRGNSLVINTDGEASHYHSRLAKQAERSIHRNLHHLVKTVNIGGLSAAERSDHERRVSIWAMKAGRLKLKTIGGARNLEEPE